MKVKRRVRNAIPENPLFSEFMETARLSAPLRSAPFAINIYKYFPTRHECPRQREEGGVSGGVQRGGKHSVRSCFILVSDWLCVTSPAIGRGACSPTGVETRRVAALGAVQRQLLLKWPTVTRSPSGCKNRIPWLSDHVTSTPRHPRDRHPSENGTALLFPPAFYISFPFYRDRQR